MTLSDRIAEATAEREAREHGHPQWSHLVAFGPCTRPSAFDAHREQVRRIRFTNRDNTGSVYAR